MSSRALRRLQQEAAVIKVSGGLESSSGDEEKPGFSSSKSKKNNTSSNPFGAVSGVLCLLEMIKEYCTLPNFSWVFMTKENVIICGIKKGFSNSADYIQTSISRYGGHV